MRIAIVSDTHLPRFGRRLPRALLDGFEAAGIERILHAGDWTDPLAVDLLEADRDRSTAWPATTTAPSSTSGSGRGACWTVDGVRLGLTHGHLGPGATTPERATGVR